MKTLMRKLKSFLEPTETIAALDHMRALNAADADGRQYCLLGRRA